MSHFANQVIHLLEDLRRLSFAEEQQPAREPIPPPVEETRPPKRPWEDMAREDHGTPNESGVRSRSIFFSRLISFSADSLRRRNVSVHR